ncbi:hypothetical protein EJ110_NYTH26235 [Nymphaea thermarum]|nr:hypothetical protein EJ110_NYTH26235 [Nymphaea thermarum]
MGRPSWGLTIFTQLALCGLLCVAFFMGKPQNPGREEPLDVYFMSVSGGHRPLKHQINLLKQMEKLVKSYNVKFVVSISEFGDEDPLLQNVSRNFPSLNIPWYWTNFSQGKGHLAKQITIPYGNILDIVFIDTRMLKDMYLSTQARIGHYIRDKGITYIGNPEFGIESRSFPSENDNSGCISGAEHGFLLHRVSPLEIESYFMDTKGKVVFRSTLHQRGKEVI